MGVAPQVRAAREPPLRQMPFTPRIPKEPFYFWVKPLCFTIKEESKLGEIGPIWKFKNAVPFTNCVTS